MKERKKHTEEAGTQYHLRLPLDLKTELELRAKRERRSLNQYLVILLESTLQNDSSKEGAVA